MAEVPVIEIETEMEEVTENEVITIDDDDDVDHEAKAKTAGKSPEEVMRVLESWKETGNDYYRAKDYKIAVEYYTRAIDMSSEPNFTAICLTNRSACHIANSMFREAIKDCETALIVDPTFTKPCARILKCRVLLGEFAVARRIIDEKLSKNEDIKTLDPEFYKEMVQFNITFDTWNNCKKCFDNKDFRWALFHVNKLISSGVVNDELKNKKANCLIKLKRWSDALDLVNSILCHNKDVDALFLRGICVYYDGDIDRAVSDFTEVLTFVRDDPKNSEYLKKARSIKRKREEGKKAFTEKRYQEAFVLYTEALKIDATNDHQNSILYCNRAVAGLKLEKFEECLSDCNMALQLKKSFAKALKVRGDCHKAMENFELALKDREALDELQPSDEHKRLIQEAKIDLKKSKRKDFYKILGVSKNAHKEDISKAYKNLAKIYHPDKNVGQPEDEIQKRQEVFKNLQEAYQILSNDKTRRAYDSNLDFGFNDNYREESNYHFTSSPFSGQYQHFYTFN